MDNKHFAMILPLLIISIFTCNVQTKSHFTMVRNTDISNDFTPAPSHTHVINEECKNGAHCFAFVQCPAHVQEAEKKSCHLSETRLGICCNTGQNHTGSFNSRQRTKLAVVSDEMLNIASKSSRTEVNGMLQKENFLLMSGRNTVIPEGTPSFGHYRNNRITNPHDLSDILSVSKGALEITLATRTLKDRHSFSNEQLELGMIESDLHRNSLESACRSPPMCPRHLRYRTTDGTCNNPIHGAYGAILSPFSRLLPASYSDGVWSPRVSVVHGQPLPSTRLISNELIPDVDRPDGERTLMVMQFGQFIAHDISRTVDARFSNGSGISCCTRDGSVELPIELRHHACMPITVSPQDNFYYRFKHCCMNFVRSILAPNHNCRLGYAQQMNKVTHFIDGSAIYGTDAETNHEVRAFTGGQLRMFRDFERDLLPLSKDPNDCLTMERGSACFFTGDSRGNLMITLVAIHTLFAREHNRLARELSMLNPHWSDETLYQETRRIVVAELQHITYSQWLPEIIGPMAMREFHLKVNRNEFSRNYDAMLDPSVTNEFTTAAFRFGHSIVDGKLKILGHNKLDEIIDIPEVVFYPSRMRKVEFFDEILSTLTTERMQKFDNSITEGLTKYLFRAGNPFGMDLAAINIQRGRDHGLRPYNDYRELVGLHRYVHFHEFGQEVGAILQKIYASVEDVDLFIGGLLERPTPDSILGPTFRDIIADQFNRLRRGDRYFYDLESDINPIAFTPAQLSEIKKITLSRIICDNSDAVLLARQSINAFRVPGLPGNELLECNSPAIPSINLLLWRE